MLEALGEELSSHLPDDDLIQSVIMGDEPKLLRLLHNGISPNSHDEVLVTRNDLYRKVVIVL